MAQNLGQVLVEAGVLEAAQLDGLLRDAGSSRRLGDLIVERGLMTSDRLIATVSRQLQMETVDPERTPIHERVLSLIPADLARRHRIIPIARRKDGEADVLIVATTDPFDVLAESAIATLLPDVEVRYLLATDDEISGALKHHYGNGVQTGGSAAPAVMPKAEMGLADTVASATRQVSGITIPAADVERVGRFVLLEKVAVEPNAEVFLTDQATADGRRIALRRPPPTLPKNDKTRSRFFGDAERVMSIKHGGVLEVCEVESSVEHWYVAQEYVEGSDLGRLLQRAKKARVHLPERAALHLLFQVLEALDYAATTRGPDGKPMGLVHTGLSPTSVILSNEGVAKVQSFGVEETTLRSPYQSPEQIRQAKTDQRTVQFRAGLILFELLSGVPLLAEGSQEELDKKLPQIPKLFRQHCPDAPDELEQILVRLLSPTPAARYPSFREVLDRIEALIGNDADRRLRGDLGRFVKKMLSEEEEVPTDLPQIRDSVVPQKIEAIVDKAAPKVQEVSQKSSESVAMWLERFGAWFDAAPRSQKLATILIPIAIVVGTLVGVALRGGRDPTPPPVTIDTGENDPVPTAAEADPEIALVAPPRAPEIKVEILPGISDAPAPEGMSYVAIEGAELRATSADDSEALLWLESGTLVERVREPTETSEGRVLVLLPPSGPAGFMSPEVLVETKPLAVLAKEIGFKRCVVNRNRTLDDCLVHSKNRADTCAASCKEHSPGNVRCAEACRAAFDRCAQQCNDAQATYEQEQKKKKRRRRRRRR